jgi:hypothetical protein
MSRNIYRVELRALDLFGAATIYHFATEHFSTTPAHPTIPSTFLEGRLVQPLLFQRTMFGSGQTRGSSQIAHGTIELSNQDGGLDYLAAAAFDTQDVKLFRFDSDTPDTEILVWRGATESALLDEQQVKFTVREFTYLLDLAMQPNKYAGSNSLPNGLEGNADDIKGQPKPLWWGQVYNVTPPMVNTSRLIYQLRDTQVAGSSYTLVVYDRRVVLTPGVLRTNTKMGAGAARVTCTFVNGSTTVTSAAAHGYTTGNPVNITSTATMPPPFSTTAYYYARVLTGTTFSLHPTAADASANTAIITATGAGTGVVESGINQTPAGSYDWSNDNIAPSPGFFFRLGSSPVGQVTCDAYDGVVATFSEALHELINRTNGRINPFAGASIIDASTLGYSPNATITNQKVGVFITQETTVFAQLQALCESLNASFSIYPTSVALSPIWLLVARLEPATSQTPLMALTDSDIIAGSFQRGVASDPERGIPAWRANVGYKRNYTIQQPAEIPSASQADRSFAAIDYRVQQSDSSVVKTQYPGAPEVNIQSTQLVDLASAQELSTYLVNTGPNGIYSRRRDLLTFSIATESCMGLALSLTNSGGPSVSYAGLSALVMGQTISVDFGRYPGPRPMLLIGTTINLASGTVELTCWG